MRMLEPLGHTAWTTCEECGNDFSAGTYRCGRCGHALPFLRRLASFASAALGKKSPESPRHSQSAYPALAEGALKVYRARRQRLLRMIWVGALAVGRSEFGL
jgi:predicted amidophosphoribosyltransferase